MQYLFEPDIYTDRRRVLQASMQGNVLLFPGNKNSPINYAANYYRFRQDSNFLYYAGLDLPGLNLVIDADKGTTILYGDDATMEDVVWTGPQPTLKELAASVGIADVRPASRLFEDYADCSMHTLPPYRAEHYAVLQRLATHADCSVAPSEQLILAVVSQREIKGPEEVAQMEEALEITAQMHTKVMRTAKSGMRESVLAGVATGIARANEGEPAYGIILSRDGHILHNHHYHNVLQKGDLVLGDFGAENRMRYAADITRTFPVDKRFSPEQADIYNIVLEAEMKGINAVRPGQMFRDVHLLASQIIADGLIAMGLMRGNPEDAVASGAHALFFPHGLGHMIGLDVHDMEGLGEDHVGYGTECTRSDQFGLAYLRMAKSLRPGHVVTVEPGIYFIPALIDQWQRQGLHQAFIAYDKLTAFRNFGGVRIEDNVLVTAEGQRVLGPRIPKTVAEVESLRAKA
ncbi:MAG: aminopeptidase P family protein [Saprospiraceae bacterium]|nr:aminopeptidase P family protein [Saprospiraceae bacterium]